MSPSSQINLCLMLAGVCFILTVCTSVHPWNLIFLGLGFVCLYADRILNIKR
jgi:hypothetical protein